MYRRIKISTIGFALLAMISIVPGLRSEAQVVGIAAVINDEIVSAYDLEQRLKMIISSARLRDNSETRRRFRGQAMRALIDDHLRLQEAKRRNIVITADDLARARSIIEKQNKIKPGEFGKFLQAQGIDEEIVLTKLRAEIAWNKLISRRLKRRIQISEDEIDEIFERFTKSEGLTERQLGEIFLGLTRASDVADIERTAIRIVKQLRDGASFTAVARQFSQGVSAEKGGVVGWILEGQLGPEVESALTKVAVGGYTDPVRTVEGIYIYYLRNVRRVGTSDPLAATVALKQLALPLAKQAAQSEVDGQFEVARRFAALVKGCDDIERAAAEVGSSGAGSLGKLRVADLPPRFRNVVTELKIGQPSEPLRTDQGFHVLMVCERIAAKVYRPDRDAIAEALGQQRLSMMSRRLLRDLRRDAIIDVR